MSRQEELEERARKLIEEMRKDTLKSPVQQQQEKQSKQMTIVKWFY